MAMETYHECRWLRMGVEVPPGSAASPWVAHLSIGRGRHTMGCAKGDVPRRMPVLGQYHQIKQAIFPWRFLVSFLLSKSLPFRFFSLLCNFFWEIVWQKFWIDDLKLVKFVFVRGFWTAHKNSHYLDVITISCLTCLTAIVAITHHTTMTLTSAGSLARC